MGEDAVSGWKEGWGAVFGGAVACWLGMTWGGAIARETWIWELAPTGWSVGGMATWFAVFLRSLAWGHGWGGVGWIVLSVATVLGATRWDWNRLSVVGWVSIATGLAGWWALSGESSCRGAENACPAGTAAWWQLGVAALLVLLGVAQSRAWFARAARKLRRRGAEGEKQRQSQ
jgi:hypothetical protein